MCVDSGVEQPGVRAASVVTVVAERVAGWGGRIPSSPHQRNGEPTRESITAQRVVWDYSRRLDRSRSE